MSLAVISLLLIASVLKMDSIWPAVFPLRFSSYPGELPVALLLPTGPGACANCRWVKFILPPPSLNGTSAPWHCWLQCWPQRRGCDGQLLTFAQPQKDWGGEGPIKGQKEKDPGPQDWQEDLPPVQWPTSRRSQSVGAELVHDGTIAINKPPPMLGKKASKIPLPPIPCSHEHLQTCNPSITWIC